MDKNKQLPFERVWLDSKVLGKEVENIVILPEHYTRDRSYPILYLLVGADNPVDAWVTFTHLCTYAAKFNMIIATPNNGWQSGQSWYVDSKVLENSAYETYVTEEFPAFMRDRFGAREDRSGRGISGISMGGHGAVTLAAKHPELYASASAFMGIMDLETWGKKGTWLNESITGALGEYETNAESWRANSAIQLVERLKPGELPLKLSCGTGDTQENGWGAYPDNERLHRRLEELNLKHDYFTFPGEHSYLPVDEFLEEYLDFHYRSFDTSGT